ncbi:PREDICTED: LOB domain-containing protein 41-like [Ipomoea nil]|uniref:LOB domain-containing protein 41-like n=1 Tax=Ipomoea nil TaxID=35883 RepID=UPI0009010D60|nr:PREDICTED: LOB domain-containing protein 41-like [Ipomoea nil]
MIFKHLNNVVVPYELKVCLSFLISTTELESGVNMRLSCNGCRVLRKGCSEDCIIRPCLEWIKNPQSQANATVFLAKFYGRAGLLNLINAGPLNLRPAIFRSLLYEACGRIVNPIYGSVGLLWSGNWQLCQNAVQAVLKGDPVVPITSATTNNEPPLKFCDIRHVNKDENCAVSTDLHRVRTRCLFKKSRNTRVRVGFSDEEGNRSTTSHESSLSHQSHMEPNLEEASREVESSAMAAAESSRKEGQAEAGDGEIELELTLGRPRAVSTEN